MTTDPLFGLEKAGDNAFVAHVADLTGRIDPFVLQIGGYDGVSFDPVRAAITAHALAAVVLEPQPEFFERLQESYAPHPRVRCVRRAIARHNGTATLHRVPVEIVLAHEGRAWAGGIATLFPERNLLGGKGASPEAAALFERIRTRVEVDCSTLERLIEDCAIERIDVFVVDAEGADWMILQQLDLSRFRPALLHFEVCNLPPEECADARAWAEAAGYRLMISANGADVIAVRTQP